MDSTFAALIAGLLAVGLYKASRFLPESVGLGRSANPYPVGQMATVVEIDTPLSEGWYQGRVHVQGEAWRARLSMPVPRVGEIVRIIGGEGATLLCVTRDARPTADVVTTDPRVDLILGALGRTMAAGLGAVLASISLLAMIVAPLAAGLALFGFFAPFAAVLALITVGSPSGGAGCTLRGLRAVIAATFGLTAFVGLTFGVAPAMAPGCAGLILMALDPTLGVVNLALGGGASDG